MSLIITTWEEVYQLRNDKYFVDPDSGNELCGGFIKPIHETEETLCNRNYFHYHKYLSVHMFDDPDIREFYTKMFHDFGFDVEIGKLEENDHGKDF